MVEKNPNLFCEVYAWNLKKVRFNTILSIRGWFLQANYIVWIKRSDVNPIESNCLFVSQNTMLRVYGTKGYRVYPVLPTYRYNGNLIGSLLLNISLIIRENVLISIKALCRIDSHATMLKLSGIYHFVCYRKSLHHATLKWVVLQWFDQWVQIAITQFMRGRMENFANSLPMHCC